MKRISKNLLVFCILLVVGLLAACNTEKGETKESNNEMRVYKDYKGHEVEIPVSPERVVYHGENFGDLIPLDVNTVGGAFDWITGHVFEDQVKNVEDVGFPISLEKTLSLKPDLIIIGDTDKKVYDQLSKIAPTVVFDTFAPINERLPELGEILGKKQEATAWVNDYNKKEENMWKQLIDDGAIKQGETATVLTYYPGGPIICDGEHRTFTSSLPSEWL